MSREDYAKRILDNARQRGDILHLDCGYYHYRPCMPGAIPAEALRIIADELDRLNKDWDEQIQKAI